MSKLNKFGEIDAQKCAGCGEPIETDWNHCPKCGRALRRVCDGCGKPMEADWIVCPRCGAGSGCSVVLVAVPADKKIAIIKVLRESVPGLSLSEAKHLTESTPCKILTKQLPDGAKQIIDLLAESGAKAELRTP